MAAKLNSVNTLSEFASYANKLDLSHEKMHLQSKLNFNDYNIILNSTSLPNKYWDYILDTTYKTTLSDVDLIH